MSTIRSISVFCGSSSRVAESHRSAASRLGALIAGAGVRLIYGGGKVGLMGLLADAALAARGKVVGVIPSFLYDLEVGHEGLTELRRVDTMHERKRLMGDLADAFVVLPGGFGTLEEAIEVVTWKQLGLHDKPVVLVDVDGFWQPLVGLIEHLVAEGFAHPEHRTLFTLVHSVDEVLGALESAPPTRVRSDAKWSRI